MEQATLAGLDWDVVLDHLKSHARTHRGVQRAGQPDFAANIDEAQERYAAVSEVWALADVGAELPLGGIMDIAPQGDRAARGEVLEPETLVDIGNTLAAISRLCDWVAHRKADVPALMRLAGQISLDDTLAEDLVLSFDSDGRISGDRYPDLARLRARHGELRADIRRTLERMLSDPKGQPQDTST